MVERLKKIKKINILPRWMIFLLDLSVSAFSLVLAYLLRFNFDSSSLELGEIIQALELLTAFNVLVFFVVRTYAGIIRFTSIQDTYRILLVVFLVNFGCLITNIAFERYAGQQLIPYSVILINALASFLFLNSYRIGVKFIYSYLMTVGMSKKNILIYGAGEAGIATKRTFDQDSNAHIQVRAFLDDDPRKSDKVIDGVKIYHTSELKKLIEEYDIAELVIAAFSLPSKEKSDLVDICLDNNIKVLTVPPLSHWINGHFSAKQIQKIKIEDLLDREPIMLYNEIITDQLKGKRVLVTGAAGSIGSEIVRQLIKYNPALIILNDQAESPLYDLELEMQELGFDDYVICLTDVRNQAAAERMFHSYQPQYVYHAAAYKHVPMMEHSPCEAVLTNVMGTKHIADLAVAYQVKRFVMVSTDKAVNPTNVMGTTKRIAEMYVQSLHHELGKKGGHVVKFITTRFGNVLGSNGSVIPRFKKQIEEGGPVTVTHPDITRFFMTIPEACQLVLEAGSMGNGGEIFVFDMGKSVKIADLAKKMIRLSGFTPGVDIKIKYTGLRPGEKLYEELLNNAENTVNTYHDKILIAKVREVEYNTLITQIDELIEKARSRSSSDIIVATLKEMVPEYVTSNPAYEKLLPKQPSPVVSMNKAG
jgi:FlaA1/EpsC-like NDP-sugar epimerase